MKIISLVENETQSKMIKSHGLSLYIETKKHKILFDTGSNDTLFKNAKIKNINLLDVDILIISHGHIDHGGALKKFLEINSKAKVYIQEKAFEKHYTKLLAFKINVGIDKNIKNNSRIVLVNGDFEIDENLKLFTVEKTDKCNSPFNDFLFDENGKDTFLHEQNLIIKEDKTALILGCGHAGIVNIMDKAREDKIDLCVGGFHLFNPFTKKTVSLHLIEEIAKNLEEYKSTNFYTCHCTGIKAFKILREKMENMFYLYCGDEVEI